MNRYIFSFARSREASFLSHLDMLRMFQRALRRSALPLAYSEGFNPHPRLSLAAPLPVGVTAEQEYGELVLKEERPPEEVLAAFSAQLPAGFSLKQVIAVDPSHPSPAAVVNAAAYEVHWSGSGPAPAIKALKEAVSRLLGLDRIPVERRKKNKTVVVDVRPYLIRLAAAEKAGLPWLDMILQTGSTGGVSPFIILGRLLEQLEGQETKVEADWLIHRRGLYIYKNGALQVPVSKGGEHT